jgi:hypothetical protein
MVPPCSSSAGTRSARASTSCSLRCGSCLDDLTSLLGGRRPARTPRACAPQHGGDARIEWLGRVTDADKVARLKRATVFCAPSLHGESFGVVLVEAMAAGTPRSWPAASTATATWPPHDVDAVLVEPGDHDALAAGLQRVLYDPRTSATDWSRRAALAPTSSRCGGSPSCTQRTIDGSQPTVRCADGCSTKRTSDRRVSRMLARARATLTCVPRARRQHPVS